MSVVNLRQLQNHPNLPVGIYNNPEEYSIYAEDWQALRDALQNGKYGLYTNSVETEGSIFSGSTLESVGAATIGGALAVGGALVAGGSGTFGGSVAVTGNITVSGTVDGVDISTHDHSGGAGAPIVTAGITDGAVTFAKLASAAVASAAASLDSSHVVRGDIVADVKSTLANHASGFRWLPAPNFWLVSRTVTGATAGSLINPYSGGEALLYVLYGTTAMNPPLLRFAGGSGSDSGVALVYVYLPPGITSGSLTYRIHHVSTAVSAGQSYTITHGYRLIPVGPGVAFGVSADDITWPADYATATLTRDDTTAANVLLTTDSGTIATTGGTMMAIAMQKPTGASSGANFYLVGVSLHWTPSYAL